MKNRIPYILKTGEIDALMAGLAAHGPQQTYEQMLVRATLAMGTADDIDDMFLDMYESMLKQARTVDNDKQLRDSLYLLASMLRKLAHEIHAAYLHLGKNKDNTRFLRIVSYNTDAPNTTW